MHEMKLQSNLNRNDDGAIISVSGEQRMRQMQGEDGGRRERERKLPYSWSEIKCQQNDCNNIDNKSVRRCCLFVALLLY